MLSSRVHRTTLSIIFILQNYQIQAKNDLEYFLESPSLLTTSEIAEEIMNQNLNSNCANLRAFYNSETFQDAEKILNLTTDSSEVKENREEYHSRMKRCSEMERQNRILREFEKHNRKNDHRKLGKNHVTQKQSKGENIHGVTPSQPQEQNVDEDLYIDYSLRGDLARSVDSFSPSTENYRTTREILKHESRFEQASSVRGFNQNMKISSSTISYPNPYTKLIPSKNTYEFGPTKASENTNKTKKGIISSLFGNIRNVMEGGTLKNKNDSSHFESSERSSLTDDFSNDTSFIEYETVTPHKIFNLNEQENIKSIQKIQEETKKQLQFKIDELVELRKKLLEIVKNSNLAKNQTKIMPSSTKKVSESKNRKIVKNTTSKESVSARNSKNVLNLKNQFDNKANQNIKIDTSSNSSAKHKTAIAQNLIKKFTTLKIPLNEPLNPSRKHQTASKSADLKNIPSANAPVEHANLVNHHTMTQPLPLHGQHMRNLIQDSDSPQNRHHSDQIFTIKRQNIEMRHINEEINSNSNLRKQENVIPQKISSPVTLEVTKNLIKTTPFMLDSHSNTEKLPTKKDSSISNKPITNFQTHDTKTKIPTKKNSEITAQENISFDDDTTTIENQSHTGTESVYAKLGKGTPMDSIRQQMKHGISTQHLTTPMDAPFKSNHQHKTSSGGLSHEMHHHHLNETSHIVQPILKNRFHITTTKLEKSEDFPQIFSKLEQSHLNKITTPSIEILSKDSALEESSHSSTNTPFKLSYNSDIRSESIKGETKNLNDEVTHQLQEIFSKSTTSSLSNFPNRYETISKVTPKLKTPQNILTTESTIHPKERATTYHHLSKITSTQPSFFEKVKHPRLIDTLAKLRNIASKKPNSDIKSTVKSISSFGDSSSKLIPSQKSIKDIKGHSSLHDQDIKGISTHQPSNSLQKSTIHKPKVASTLTPRLIHQHQQSHHSDTTSTIQPSHSFEMPWKGITPPMKSQVEKHPAPEKIHQHHEKGINSLWESHQEDHSISQAVHHHPKLAYFEEASTLLPSNPTQTFSKAILPQVPRLGIDSNPHSYSQSYYSKGISLPDPLNLPEKPFKDTILPEQKSNPEDHPIPQSIHHHSKLPHYERTSTFQPSNPTTMPFEEVTSPKKSHEGSNPNHHLHSHPHHLKGTSFAKLEKEESTMPQNPHLDHLVPQPIHLHLLHPHNLDKLFPKQPSQSTEAPSKTTSFQNFHTEKGINSKSNIKSSELHSKDKIPQFTPSQTHLSSTPQPKILHHSTIDNNTSIILEEIKRLEKEKIEEIKNKIEEIKNYQKSQHEALYKHGINNPSHINSPDSDTSHGHKPSPPHIIDSTSSHSFKEIHKGQDRSNIEQDHKAHHFHSITKPYKIDFTTPAAYQENDEILEKIPKPLPPLNPNDNWKYMKKLDNYYEKQKHPVTPQPSIRPPLVTPTSQPRTAPSYLVTPSSPITPATVAPKIRPSTPSRNITIPSQRPQGRRSGPTKAPPTRKPSRPVNYNINSTINRNYNITINLVTPESATNENNGDEQHTEDDNLIEPVIEEEPDPMTNLARPTQETTIEESSEDFDSPPHPSLQRQSSLETFNSSSDSSLDNETSQLPSTTTIQTQGTQPITFLQTEISPSDDSFRNAYTFGNKDAILQSPLSTISKPPDRSLPIAISSNQDIINNLKSITLKVQNLPYSENLNYFTTQPSTTTIAQNITDLPLLSQTTCSGGNCTSQRCNNIIIIPNKTEEIMEILHLLDNANTNDQIRSTEPGSSHQNPKSAQNEFSPRSNSISDIKSLLKSIQNSKLTVSENAQIRNAIGELLTALKQRRTNEYNKLYISKINPMVGDGRDSIQLITQINEYIELLELMMVYLARDPGRLLDENRDARSDNFESPYPLDDPQRRLIEDQFYYVNPKILNEFIDVYKKYSKDETYYGKPMWQFSQENGPRRASRPRGFANSLSNLFNFKELIPALTYNRGYMYNPGIQYDYN